MEDITTRKDIDLLVREFYTRVRANNTLGYIFDDVMKVDWDHHMPILVDFWETVLLDTAAYSRNAMGEHFKINQKVKLEAMHFETWLRLFDETVDTFFQGEKATLAKKRAHSVAGLMQLKMDQINRTRE